MLNKTLCYLHWRCFDVGGVPYRGTLDCDALEASVRVDAELLASAVVLPAAALVDI